ncbi:hypothetical protein [Halococcus hamelinensis]|uniref:DUF340 domain-containing protein n=1 Tax=Halococcus hamelinensis 100A6 TaxID=1132509 RepID=M0LX11_9EURY|nr:hypothetical protein [Halococcus hamelinensis]EMA37708.1 hypothetical protein C447_12070 [Halococcus hamelinensis 100A6]
MELTTRQFSQNTLIMLLVIGTITLIGNWVGYGISPVEAAPGMALIVVIGVVSLLLGRFVPLELPSFAYAMVIAFLLSLPYSPVQATILSLTEPVNFLATTTPILAYAGLSVGSQVTQMRKVSWKLVVVAVFVFFGTFFGSALVAQAVMSIQGSL